MIFSLLKPGLHMFYLGEQPVSSNHVEFTLAYDLGSPQVGATNLILILMVFININIFLLYLDLILQYYKMPLQAGVVHVL